MKTFNLKFEINSRITPKTGPYAGYDCLIEGVYVNKDGISYLLSCYKNNAKVYYKEEEL